MMDNMNYEQVEQNVTNKAPKKHPVRKAISFVLAMALVSAGSIGAWEYYTDDTVTTASVATTTSVSDTASANTVSTLTTSTASDNTLTTADIVEKCTPSVVGIESTFTYTQQNTSGYYFGMQGEDTTQDSTMSATGTGVIYSSDGYIVTNAHVIYDSEYNCGLATSVQVVLSDGETTYDAEVIGYDTDCDLAVLKIEATGLTAATFADSDECRVGDSVIAIGNPLGMEFQNSVTSGIISALNREVTINDKDMTLIQTDAAINAGNSGGPLINTAGQVIGINSSKMSSSYSETTVEGMGFAIPSSEVVTIVKDLMEYGYVTGKPQLGLSCQTVTDNISQMYGLAVGAYVTAVTEGSAADEAGIEVGDVITAVNDTEVTSSDELVNAKNQYNAGDTITLTVNRNGQELQLQVTLDEENASANAQ